MRELNFGFFCERAITDVFAMDCDKEKWIRRYFGFANITHEFF